MSFEPTPLLDLVPGNIGLIAPPRARLLWHFDEPAGVQPTDAAGNLDDLGTEPGVVAPLPGDAFAGFGRAFVRSSTNALLAADLSGRDTLLQRDVTVQALISLTLTGAAGPHTVIARGLNDGSISERYAFGLELEEVVPGDVEIRMFWQDSAGVLVTAPGGSYQHPGDGEEVLITATRRWETTTLVVVRYYVNDELLAEHELADGDISGGTTGRTTVGGLKAAGVWDAFLNGTIDELLVTDTELSHDEIRHTYKRLTEYQPGGVETIMALAPVGLGWAQNPDSNQGRRMKITGQALGLAVANTEELRAMFLPDRMPLELAPRWERLCGLTAKPRDSLDTRRTRVVSYLAREEGLNLPAIRTAFAEVLDAEADDLEIIESTQTITDAFTAIATGRWREGDVGTWSVVAGEAHLAVAAAVDITFSADLTCLLRTSLDTGGGRIYTAVKLASWGVLPASVGVGMYLHNRRTNDLLWFGVYNDAGTHKIGHRKIVAGVAGAFVAIVNAPGAGPVWLRMSSITTGAVGTFDLSYSITGAGAGFITTQVVAGVAELDWSGFLAFSAGVTAAVIAVDFDDFLAYTPDGTMPFYWYVFRDPGLPGAPDMIGANALARKVKPAHTYGAACEGLTVICDGDRYGLCGRGPLGS